MRRVRHGDPPPLELRDQTEDLLQGLPTEAAPPERHHDDRSLPHLCKAHADPVRPEALPMLFALSPHRLPPPPRPQLGRGRPRGRAPAMRHLRTAPPRPVPPHTPLLLGRLPPAGRPLDEGRTPGTPPRGRLRPVRNRLSDQPGQQALVLGSLPPAGRSPKERRPRSKFGCLQADENLRPLRHPVPDRSAEQTLVHARLQPACSPGATPPDTSEAEGAPDHDHHLPSLRDAVHEQETFPLPMALGPMLGTRTR
jgi:hypothetical protein